MVALRHPKDIETRRLLAQALIALGQPEQITVKPVPLLVQQPARTAATVHRAENTDDPGRLGDVGRGGRERGQARSAADRGSWRQEGASALTIARRYPGQGGQPPADDEAAYGEEQSEGGKQREAPENPLPGWDSLEHPGLQVSGEIDEFGKGWHRRHHAGALGQDKCTAMPLWLRCSAQASEDSAPTEWLARL